MGGEDKSKCSFHFKCSAAKKVRNADFSYILQSSSHRCQIMSVWTWVTMPPGWWFSCALFLLDLKVRILCKIGRQKVRICLKNDISLILAKFAFGNTDIIPLICCLPSNVIQAVLILCIHQSLVSFHANIFPKFWLGFSNLRGQNTLNCQLCNNRQYFNGYLGLVNTKFVFL